MSLFDGSGPGLQALLGAHKRGGGLGSPEGSGAPNSVPHWKVPSPDSEPQSHAMQDSSVMQPIAV